jgi:hypothetical protein
MVLPFEDAEAVQKDRAGGFPAGLHYGFSHQIRRPCGAGGVMAEFHWPDSCASVD